MAECSETTGASGRFNYIPLIEASVLLVGDERVGKSSLLRVWANQAPIPYELMHNNQTNSRDECEPLEDIVTTLSSKTVGLDYCSRTVDNTVTVKAFDASGDKKFHNLVMRYAEKADGYIFAFDPFRRETLKSLTDYWLPLLITSAIKKPIVVAAISSSSKNNFGIDDSECIESCKSLAAGLHTKECDFVRVNLSTTDDASVVFRNIAEAIAFRKLRVLLSKLSKLNVDARKVKSVLRKKGLSEQFVAKFGKEPLCGFLEQNFTEDKTSTSQGGTKMWCEILENHLCCFSSIKDTKNGIPPQLKLFLPSLKATTLKEDQLRIKIETISGTSGISYYFSAPNFEIASNWARGLNELAATNSP